jgi:aminopeptidase YwaD
MNSLLKEDLTIKAKRYLRKFCEEISTRAVGSRGNQIASKYFHQIIQEYGFEVENQEFDCIHWVHGKVELNIGDKTYPIFASPYSLGCDIETSLIQASTPEALRSADIEGKVLLLHKEIAKEQVMPKNFPFYNPPEHKALYDLLEIKSPSAIITASPPNHDMTAALYPYPMFEDGDFNIPSVYTTEDIGEILATFENKEIRLISETRRIPSKGENIVARKGDDTGQRVIIVAHIDSKIGTPGALDNASGTIVLLLLAELLKQYNGKLGIEIVSLNGEDYYDASGQKLYLDHNRDHFTDIILAINIDGVGFKEGRTAYSSYQCPKAIETTIQKVFTDQDVFMQGSQWYQSDHSIFIQQGIPAMALTLEKFGYAWSQIAHTERDVPEIIKPDYLVEISVALSNLIEALNHSL